MKRISLVLLLALVITAPLSAGVVYEIETKDHEQSPPKSETIEIAAQGRNLKMGISGGEGGKQGEMIFRADRREMVVVDHDSKSYMIMDEKAISGIAGQMGEAMKQLKDAMAGMPEKQRALFEKTMSERGGLGLPAAAPVIEVELRGPGGEQAGYPTLRYEALKGGRKTQDLWVTEWDEIEGGREAAGAFEEMAGFFRDMMDALSQATQGAGPLDGIGDSIFALLDKVDGFPVITKSFDEEGELEGESALRSASRRTLDPDEFEPPSGYKRRQMFLGN